MIGALQTFRENRRVLGWALLACASTFAFAFALVPLYRIACEQIFGIRLEQTPTGADSVAGYEIDEDRWVTVEFDAGTNSRLPWSFWSERTTMQVRPGEMNEALFFARNDDAGSIVGQAVPSVSPPQASIYFNKTECFCFTEQLLASGEERPMPVRFVIDPDLPAQISTVTLSYTFFNNEHATTRLLSASGHSEPR
jgi:cytochrome c oxidase assembly protein subunit 11